MDITWDEFQAVAPHLDEVTQLRVMNAVLVLRLDREHMVVQGLHDQLMSKEHAIERLEDDLRNTNGAPA